MTQRQIIDNVLAIIEKQSGITRERILTSTAYDAVDARYAALSIMLIYGVYANAITLHLPISKRTVQRAQFYIAQRIRSSQYLRSLYDNCLQELRHICDTETAKELSE
jgi:hypothetical protein